MFLMLRLRLLNLRIMFVGLRLFRCIVKTGNLTELVGILVAKKQKILEKLDVPNRPES